MVVIRSGVSRVEILNLLTISACAEETFVIYDKALYLCVIRICSVDACSPT